MPAFRLYLVTDRSGTQGRPLLDVVEAAVRGGVDAVQLRAKDLPIRALIDLAREVKAVCVRHGARLLINDRIDVALAIDADGVHLPAASFNAADARALVGAQKLIGVSTHTLSEAVDAQRQGADFVVFGPVFDTPSKQRYGPPVGLDPLAGVTRKVTLPVLAIGGVTIDRVEAVRRRGASGVAVVSGILAAPDPREAARAYVTRLQDSAHVTS